MTPCLRGECTRPAVWRIVGGATSCTTHLGKLALARGVSSMVVEKLPEPEKTP